MYSSTLSLTSVQDVGRGQRHAPAALYPGKIHGTHCIGGWVGPQGRFGRVRKIRPQPEFDPRTVQLVASRYTDRAIPAHQEQRVLYIKTHVHKTISASILCSIRNLFAKI